MGTASMQADLASSMDSITQVSLAIMELALTATEAVMATTQAANLVTKKAANLVTKKAANLATTQAANLATIIDEKRILSLRTVLEVHATRTTSARRNVILSKQSTL